MKPNIKLVNDERLIYRYSNVKGLVNLHYNIVIITNLRVIMIYAYKPWWYYWLFIVKPNEISNTTIFTKYISSIKIKTRPIFTTSLFGPLNFNFSKKKNTNDIEHTTTSSNYFPQRYSLEDIIFKAFLRGLFFGCIFGALLWKFFNNIPNKVLIVQCLICILFNILYDFKSYSPVKYLEIYTLDGTGDDDIIANNNQKRRLKRKTHTNCNVYHGSNNSYIIEGELDELVFLRDKITSAIKESSVTKEIQENVMLKNDNSKIDKIDKKLKIMKDILANQDSLLNSDLKNIKKVIKRTLSTKNRKGETEKDNNKMKKDKSINLTNRKSNLKNKIRNTMLNKKNVVENNEEDKDQMVNKKSLFYSIFRLIISFVKFILISYLSTILLLSLIYHTTRHLEQMNN